VGEAEATGGDFDETAADLDSEYPPIDPHPESEDEEGYGNDPDEPRSWEDRESSHDYDDHDDDDNRPFDETDTATPPASDEMPKHPEAEAQREKLRTANSEVRTVEDEISQIEKRLETDYGPGMRFEPLSRECFTFKSGGEWDYEMCPFKDAKQKDSGGGSTGIGSWEGFDDGHSVMKFTNGQSCWNGPMRSLTVTMSCAAEHKILAVDEPEVCKYAMRFETPVACTEEHASSAQADLQALQPEDHDEL